MVSWAYSGTAHVTGVNHDNKFCSWPRNLTLAARRTRVRPGIVEYTTQTGLRRRTEVNRVTSHDLRPPYMHVLLIAGTHPHHVASQYRASRSWTGVHGEDVTLL